MLYKDFIDGVKLSRLGMGAMRLPVRETEEGKPIDYDTAKAIIDSAVAAGINYFDTAYIYHGGESEVFLGKALAEYPRDSYYVADKYNIEAEPNYRSQFPKQLDRLGMNRIDFYLLHGISDASAPKFLENGCIGYFEEMRAQGKIRFFGFSFHGSPATLEKLLAAHKWDFVQIQLNYYDWLFGDAKELYEMLDRAGIPVMVMEPAHGGMLATLNTQSAAPLLARHPDRTIASWAMRWVKGLDRVQVVLSGMSDMAQLSDNVATFSDDIVLDIEERDLAETAAQTYKSDVAVPCTACRYCCTNCPMGLDIPFLLKAYNEAKIGGAWRLNALKALGEDKLPAACIACGMCTKHCPQNINVPVYMTEMAELMK